MNTNGNQPVNEWNETATSYARTCAGSGGVLSPRSGRPGTLPPPTGTERIRVDYQVVGGFWNAEVDECRVSSEK